MNVDLQSTVSPDLQESVSLILFEVGGRRLGVDATQVLRVDRPDSAAHRFEALGRLAHGERALVFQTETGEAQLRVDEVFGLQRVPLDHLRRMPLAVRAGPSAVGFWLDGENAVLLINLMETKEGGQ
jgi:hypothetical protein